MTRVINFQPRFATLITSGVKRQTIRKRGRQRPPHVGEELRLYMGLKSPSPRRLGWADCLKVERLTLCAGTTEFLWAQLDDIDLRPDQIEDLAVREGFAATGNYRAERMLWQWFREFHNLRHGDRFDGYVFTWGDLRAPRKQRPN